jgi:hypothetical protein
MKEIEEDTQKMKDLHVHGLEELVLLQMFIIPTAMYKFNSILHRYRKNPKFIWKHKRPSIAKEILSKKNKAGGIITPNLKTD